MNTDIKIIIRYPFLSAFICVHLWQKILVFIRVIRPFATFAIKSRCTKVPSVPGKRPIGSGAIDWRGRGGDGRHARAGGRRQVRAGEMEQPLAGAEQDDRQQQDGQQSHPRP